MSTVAPKADPALSSSASAAKPSGGHLAYLDGLRGLAAIFVVLHHMWLEIWPFEAGVSPPHRILTWTSVLFYGHFAVVVFIVLSGFCLMLPIIRGDGTLRGGTWLFFKKRARRILPPYYFALALSLLLIALWIGQPTGTHWDTSLTPAQTGLIPGLTVTWSDLISHVLLLHDFTLGVNHINHVFWSIAVEWQIYFLFPLLLLSWRRVGGIGTTAIAMIVGYAAGQIAQKMHFTISTPHFLGMFTLGMLGATIAYSSEARWIALRQRLPWKWFALAAFLSTLALCLHDGLAHARFYIGDFFVGLTAFSVLIWASLPGKNELRTVLSVKPFVAVGGYSYSLYLIHAPLIQLIWQYGIAPLHVTPLTQFLLLATVGSPVIVGLSYIFYLGCEKPFLTRAKTVRPSTDLKAATE